MPVYLWGEVVMGSEITLVEREAQPYAAIARSVNMEEMVAALPECWPRVFGWLAEQGQAPAGAPFIRYVSVDMAADVMELEIGIPTAMLCEPGDGVMTGQFPAGTYVRLIHTGSYDDLMAANDSLQQQALAGGHSLAAEGLNWDARLECYLTDPESEPDPARWQTELLYLTR